MRKRIIIDFEHPDDFQNGVAQGEIKDIKFEGQVRRYQAFFALANVAYDMAEQLIEDHKDGCDCPEIAFYRRFVQAMKDSHHAATSRIGH